MRQQNRSLAGKARPSVVFFVLLLVCLALVLGLWLGQEGIFNNQKSGESVTAPSETRPVPARSPSRSEDQVTMILEDRLMEVAESAMPSVVNVFSEKVVQSPFSQGPFFPHLFGPGRRAPRERLEQSLGSGVIVRSDGYIVTNSHVVDGADKIRVALSDKKEYEATVVGADPKSDLAVLKIDADSLPALPMADSDKVRVGQVVLAIGNPFGLSQTVTMGIVSARGRSAVGIADYEDFIQTDAAINPGNSGGALINLDGELVGVNTAIFSRSGGYMGIGFAIPANMVRYVMDSLIKNGHVQRGFLGVNIQDLTPELAEQFGVDGAAGALVAEVFADTPAARAGIKPGDVIIAVNGETVSGAAQLKNLIAEIPPGQKATFTLIRDEKKKSVDAELMELPEPGQRPRRPDTSRPDAPEEAKLAGMTVTALTPELADRLDIERGKGVVVIDVANGSRAERSGIEVGDVIFRINRREISGMADFVEIAGQVKNKAVLLHVRRGNGSMFLVIPRTR